MQRRHDEHLEQKHSGIGIIYPIGFAEYIYVAWKLNT
jgi:hypothetical protein